MDIKLIVAQNLSRLMSQSQTLDTVKKVSARSGVGFGTVRRAKNGDGNITVDNLSAIAKAFGVDISYMVSTAIPTDLSDSIIKIKPKSARHKRIETIQGLMDEINETGLAVILDKCRDVLKEYPIAPKETQSS